MNLKTRTITLTLISLAAVGSFIPNAVARNKSTVPFVVPALCSDQPSNSSTVISNHGQFALQISGTNNQANESNDAGWEIFTSNPRVNPGSISPSPTTSAPQGVYGFVVSGLPDTGNCFVEVTSVDAAGNSSNFTDTPITNGHVFVPAPPVDNVGSPLVAVSFWIYVNSKTQTLPTIQVSGFTVNGSPLFVDTTHSDDNSDASDFTWCETY